MTTTKKLLVAFDLNDPDRRSSDFLVVVMEGTQPQLVGVKSKRTVVCGMMVYLGKEITGNELFAKLVDTGRRIDSVEGALRTLDSYVQSLRDFRIGNLVSVEADAESGFKLVKLADSPPAMPNLNP